MAVSIHSYNDELSDKFETEKKRLESLLKDGTVVEHVGSSAVGIGGKNIIDILIGVEKKEQLNSVRDLLMKNGYFEGHNRHSDRIFMANSEEETGEGDFHIHICPVNSDSFRNFLILRDYLRANPEKAQEYYKKKQVFAQVADFNREEYKKLKSTYVAKLLDEAKIAHLRH